MSVLTKETLIPIGVFYLLLTTSFATTSFASGLQAKDILVSSSSSASSKTPTTLSSSSSSSSSFAEEEDSFSFLSQVSSSSSSAASSFASTVASTQAAKDTTRITSTLPLLFLSPSSSSTSSFASASSSAEVIKINQNNNIFRESFKKVKLTESYQSDSYHSSQLSSNFNRRLSSRTVQTKHGLIRGTIITFNSQVSSNLRNLQPIETFYGVPYASAPIGKLRFMPPVTPDYWTGVRLADKFGSVCPQKLNFNHLFHQPIINTSHHYNNNNNLNQVIQQSSLLNQSEDCLYLNIYVPKDAKRVPVMVFIPGDGSSYLGPTAGSAFDPSILASHGNIIVITINYRLGILGFLGPLESASRGNFGLMDQVAALHWIQENIASFGGDANNVTITGHGSGAACVHLLMLSPMSKGLFRRVIMMSGSALSPWSMVQPADAIKNGQALARALNCPVEHKGFKRMVECLRYKKVEEILNQDIYSPTFLPSFGPTIDGMVLPSDLIGSMSSYDPVTHGFNHGNGRASSSSSGSSQSSLSSSSASASSQLSSSAGSNYNLFGSYDLMFGITRIETPCNDIYNLFSSSSGQQTPKLASPSSFDFFTSSAASGSTLSPPDGERDEEEDDLADDDSAKDKNNNNNKEEEAAKDDDDINRRDKILRTLVRNLYNYHLHEILLTISNEYTDWSRSSSATSSAPATTSPSGHPISIIDSINEVLGDALVVSPLIRTGLIHSTSSSAPKKGKTYFYNFSFATPTTPSFVSSSSSAASTEDDAINQHSLKCTHGHELSYLFGKPLSFDTSSFATSSSVAIGSHTAAASKINRIEVNLSEIMMTYFANFVKFGNPNGQESSKLSNKLLNWPHFEEQHQLYMSFSSKPKVKDHYHSHRMSFWLNLIPKLNSLNNNPKTPPGDTNHDNNNNYNHLLPDHDNLDTYEGVVRESLLFHNHHKHAPTAPSADNNKLISVKTNSSKSAPPDGINKNESSNQLIVMDGSNVDDNSADYNNKQTRDASNNNFIEKVAPSSSTPTLYSSALSAIVILGCTFLILNVLICLRLLYKEDRANLVNKTGRRSISVPAKDGKRSKRRSLTNDNQRQSDSLDGLVNSSSATNILETSSAGRELNHHHQVSSFNSQQFNPQFVNYNHHLINHNHHDLTNHELVIVNTSSAGTPTLTMDANLASANHVHCSPIKHQVEPSDGYYTDANNCIYSYNNSLHRSTSSAAKQTRLDLLQTPLQVCIDDANNQHLLLENHHFNESASSAGDANNGTYVLTSSFGTPMQTMNNVAADIITSHPFQESFAVTDAAVINYETLNRRSSRSEILSSSSNNSNNSNSNGQVASSTNTSSLSTTSSSGKQTSNNGKPSVTFANELFIH